MTCDAIQNRLLALPDLRRVPDELRGHLDECPACRAYLARAVRLDKLLATIPVPPPSEETKAAFLDRATEAGPVIKHIPVVRRDSGTYLLDNGRWKYTAAALAAAVLVAVGWLAFRGGDTPPNRIEYDTVAGHDLLTKTIGHVVTGEKALAKVDKPEQRMQAWTDVTTDLHVEIGRVYRHAPKDDLKALADLFEQVAERGLLQQADLAVTRGQEPVARRQELLRDAIQRVTEVETELAAFAQNAPEDKKPPLRQLRETARKVREGLTNLQPRLAGSWPAKGV
jgi:hypothetical protein